MPHVPAPTCAAVTLRHALLQAQQAQGVTRLEAHMLLLHALGRPVHERAWLIAHDTHILTPEVAATFAALCLSRQSGQPLAYLTGCKEFYGLNLHVDARVLDPRPDTETLVDWALALRCTFAPSACPRIADLGTGSGAIALALHSQWPQAQVWAVDNSMDALNVARANAQRLGLDVTCIASNWLSAIAGPLDIIVSNPPYIAPDDPHLAALRHEPTSALVSGCDGLHDIRTIAAQAPSRLAPGGWLLLEHGCHQAQTVHDILHAHGFIQIQSRSDLAGHTRCTGGQIPGP